MSFAFTPAKRENVPLLIGVAGGTGSGKTMSALRLARGIAAGQPFAALDTENGRMNHYADLFPELHRAGMSPPFRPERYTEGIDAAIAYLEQQGVPLSNRVALVDSMSHEWAGDGGCLDWADEIEAGDPKRKARAWATVKPAHKRMVTHLLQAPAHVILCFRSEPKVDIVREGGELKFVPKRTLPGGGLDGWLPITEKNFPYEMTASFQLSAEEPGVPRPLKLQEQHKPFVPLDQPLTEETGRLLAEWARGGEATPPVEQPAAGPSDALRDKRDRLVDLLMQLGVDMDAKNEKTGLSVYEQIAEQLAGGKTRWFADQIRNAEGRLEAAETEAVGA